jgi:hypothetical protein
MHLSNEIRLCSNQGHASATQVAIFRVKLNYNVSKSIDS